MVDSLDVQAKDLKENLSFLCNGSSYRQQSTYFSKVTMDYWKTISKGIKKDQPKEKTYCPLCGKFQFLVEEEKDKDYVVKQIFLCSDQKCGIYKNSKNIMREINALQISESFIDKENETTYTRLSSLEAEKLIKTITIPQPKVPQLCLRCKKPQILEEKDFGNAGCDCWGSEYYICSDINCGIYQKWSTSSKD